MHHITLNQVQSNASLLLSFNEELFFYEFGPPVHDPYTQRQLNILPSNATTKDVPRYFAVADDEICVEQQ